MCRSIVIERPHFPHKPEVCRTALLTERSAVKPVMLAGRSVHFIRPTFGTASKRVKMLARTRGEINRSL